jgi:hypothetical protein
MEYLVGTDAQGNLRLVRLPANGTTPWIEVYELVERALEPPYGRASTISLAEVKRLAGSS